MKDIEQYNHFFFVGVAGTGMSAIAQFLRGRGKKVSGSDREFARAGKLLIQQQLEAQGIACHRQDASGITPDVDVLVISTAIEESNPELKKAREMGIDVVKRSELLAAISQSTKTIAVGGTSGKSTTSAMIFHIMEQAGMQPSIISGAGLVSLQQKGLPGNAWNGNSGWLVIEADESDGSIVGYRPQVSVVLNIDRDHKEYEELMDLFSQFRQHTSGQFVTNQGHPIARQLSQNAKNDFASTEGTEAGFAGKDFRQDGFNISFNCQGVHFELPLIGRHNMENALAATAVCATVGIDVATSARALKSYLGIYRRTQLVGQVAGCCVIDDFAHNPAEVVCAIKACQQIGKRVWAWFQPHGFGPLRFMHTELETEVAKVLRPADTFILSDVYYAGGTVQKTVTSQEVAQNMQNACPGKKIIYVEDRNQLIDMFRNGITPGDVILTMGARDNSLSAFARQIFEESVKPHA